MSYQKTTWAVNDLITAEKMNKIEDELEKDNFQQPLLITFGDIITDNDNGNWHCNSTITAQEVINIFNTGRVILVKVPLLDTSNSGNNSFLILQIKAIHNLQYNLIGFGEPQWIICFYGDEWSDNILFANSLNDNLKFGDYRPRVY